MFISRTFSAYVARQFLLWFFGALIVLAAIIEIFDVLELFRRAAKLEETETGAVITMALLKMPHIVERLVPFAVLLGAIFTFFRLNRHHELVVVKAAGVSVWQFLLPPLGLAFFIGAVQVTLFNPFSAAMLLEYERMEAKYFQGKTSLATVSEEGLWLRQRTGDGHYILHATEITPREKQLHHVVIYLMEGEDRFIGRLDAPSAKLLSGHWLLKDARLNDLSGRMSQLGEHRVVTDLSVENIQDSFAPPETLSFWTLPRFISVLEKAGFSALRHRLYWHSKLALPLLLCAMVLLAATFSLRQVRRGGAMVVAVGGVGTGFLLFFMSDVVGALGASGSIPIALAAWSPAIISGLLGTAMLFHLEDG